MSKEKLEVSRKIIPFESVCGIVNDWRFSFQYRGIPFIEPCFAMMEPYEGAQVHGVCHKMSRDDFIHKLLGTEGGKGILEDGYVATEVDVQLYDGRIVKAYVLRGKGNVVETNYTCHPSNRYMSLIREAAHYGIDSDYMEWVESHKTYERGAFSVSIVIFFGLLIFLLLSPVLLTVYIIRRCGYNYPMVYTENIVMHVIFWNLFAHCFGSGADFEKQPLPYPIKPLQRKS